MNLFDRLARALGLARQPLPTPDAPPVDTEAIDARDAEVDQLAHEAHAVAQRHQANRDRIAMIRAQRRVLSRSRGRP